MNEWSDEHKEVLKQKWKAGISARKIGEGLGRTKNSVLGMANRMGLPKHQFTITKKKHPDTPRKPMKQIKSPKPPQHVPPITFTSSGISFMDVKPGECRAIIGRDNDRYSLVRFCSAPVKLDESFCPYHCDRFFSPRISK